MSGRRFEGARFKGLEQVWSGWVQGNDVGTGARGKHRGCSAVGSGRARGKHRGSRTGAVRGDTSAAFAVMPGAIGHMYSVQA